MMGLLIFAAWVALLALVLTLVSDAKDRRSREPEVVDPGLRCRRLWRYNPHSVAPDGTCQRRSGHPEPCGPDHVREVQQQWIDRYGSAPSDWDDGSTPSGDTSAAPSGG